MRVWVDLTNSPHVARAAAGRSSACARGARGGGHRARLRPDASSSPSASGSARPSIGRHRGARLARRRRSGCADRSRGAGALGARDGASTSRSGTAPTTSRVAAAAAADPERDDVRLRVGDGAAHGQLPPRAAPSSCPTRSRPSASRATARAGKLRRYPGLKEEYYLADFEPDAAVLDELGLDPRAPLVVVRTPPVGLALPPLRERRCSPRVLERAARAAPGRRAAAHRRPARRARARRRLRRARARDRRPVADRATPTSSSAPAAR